MKIVKTITVVGGGSSGWMTALALKNKLDNVKITLIEDPSIGAIGVGESTTPPVARFIEDVLELDYHDWFPHTDASFKVGTEFVGWSDELFYTTFKVLQSYAEPKEAWFAKKIQSPETPLEDFYDSIFPSVAMIKSGNFPSNTDRGSWAMHFNAGLFGEYLKGVSIDKGVEYIEGRVEDVIKNNSGDIASLVLAHGQIIESDLFVDCSGFKSILNRELDNEFLSVDDFLPNNKAIVVRKPRAEAEDIPLCTRATTATSGWIWEIPMRSETAIGYVFADDFIGLDDAKKELLEFSGMTDDADILEVSFKSGRYDKGWVKNCVTVGLSGGFLEPLESTGLWFTVNNIQQLIYALTKTPRVGYHNPTREVFNRNIAMQFDSVSSFIQLHFIGCHRNDTPYWKYVTEELEGNEEMMSGLMNVMNNGPHTYIPGFFETYLWSGVTMGLGLTDASDWLGRDYNEIEDSRHIHKLEQYSKRMLADIKKMKKHKDILNIVLNKGDIK